MGVENEKWVVAINIMAAVFHFRSTLALVKVEDSRRNQFLVGGMQGTDYYSSIFIDRSYPRDPLVVWAEFKFQ